MSMIFSFFTRRDVRLYEQSLSDCSTTPNNTHTIAARLQLISNLEAQLVHSAAAVQNMQMKSDVLKSLTPDDKRAEQEVNKARGKMETIRQQLEQARCVIN